MMIIKIECWSGVAVLLASPVVQITLVPLTKTQNDFYNFFWIILGNKLCDQQKFMILTCFDDFLHK